VTGYIIIAGPQLSIVVSSPLELSLVFGLRTDFAPAFIKPLPSQRVLRAVTLLSPEFPAQAR